jgi:hypothetical protein
MIGKIQTGHSIEIIALEIAEGQRTGQIGRHGHGIEALHGEGDNDLKNQEKRERVQKGDKGMLKSKRGGREHGMRCGCADGFGEKWSRCFCGERRRFYLSDLRRNRIHLSLCLSRAFSLSPSLSLPLSLCVATSPF